MILLIQNMKFEKIAKNVTLFKLRASFGLTLFHYLIEHPKGNFLVSCPGKLNDEIINKIEEIGGIDYIFITHSHDIGDACEYKEKFIAKVLIHEDGAMQFKDCKPDIIVKGDMDLSSNIQILFTPGHTPGNICLYFSDYKYLFTGDAIAANNEKPYVLRQRFGPNPGLMSDDEYNYILKKVLSKDFEKLFTVVGFVLEDPKAKLKELG